MSDGCFGQVNIVKHQIEPTDRNNQTIHSPPYRPGPKTGEFEKEDIGKMLLKKVFEPAQIGWAAPIEFPPKKDGLLCFSVDYQ